MAASSLMFLAFKGNKYSVNFDFSVERSNFKDIFLLLLLKGRNELTGTDSTWVKYLKDEG